MPGWMYVDRNAGPNHPAVVAATTTQHFDVLINTNTYRSTVNVNETAADVRHHLRAHQHAVRLRRRRHGVRTGVHGSNEPTDTS